MNFSKLSQYFDQIESNSSRLKITEVLAELFNQLTPNEIEKVVYLLQGSVAPSYKGYDFGMAERTIIKAAISALNMEKNFFEKEFKKIGDLGKTVEYFKNQYTSFEEMDLSIEKVFSIFYQIATQSGVGSNDNKTSLLSQLIRQLDPVSARFLVRIPTGNIRMGFSDMTILDAFSWMDHNDKTLRPLLQQAYHVRPELGYIGRLLKEQGEKALSKIEPKIFTPIIMMRAERMSSAIEIIDQLKKCLVEDKYDGFRLQIHAKKTHNQGSSNYEVKLFSRNLEDVTLMFPDIVLAIKDNILVDNIILEGEAIGYDPNSHQLLPFQETVTRKRKYDITEKSKKVPLKLFAFELLYLNGVSLINKPFSVRREYLVKSIKNNQIIEIAKQELVTDPQQLEDLFDQSVESKLEGIIAKKIDGVYKPGAREWNWIKYKKSYSNKINDTVDCLVMGYDFGKGKRTGFGIGAFLAGIYDESNDQFLTVAKIGTGLTDEEWKQLKIKNEQLIIKEKPKNYIVDKSMECDVWVKPKVVVEIRADEITNSPVHTSRYALRFPRLERFRDDKKPEDITSLSELKQIQSRQ